MAAAYGEPTQKKFWLPEGCCSSIRLSEKVVTVGVPRARGRGAGVVAGGLSGGGRDPVAVELEEVVGRGDQSPFRAHGGSASSLEAVDPAVELDLAEHGLDRGLALAVERAAVRRWRARGA